ncbi:uncharacterized protein LOC121694886 [Alosa sapidissima]|uniref:uncharacterized protein LOC121694886 n=1 Tax=Alosa sapidissima TaxID=34773 RepID=UPI001C0A0FC5|nr:uncharacterized protein LOC121694886 [Alosa sapidissima]
MGLFGFAILTHLLLKCYGHTYFYHQTDDNDDDSKITLSCKASLWRIDNQVDCDWDESQTMITDTVPCSQGCGGELNSQVDLDRRQKEITPNGSHPEGSGLQGPLCCCSTECGEDGTYQIEARSGFYACVCDCTFQPIYSFNPHPDVVDTYIVAVGGTQFEHELPTQQNVTEGSAILLSCLFTIHRRWSYVIYWLKVNSGNGRATCISSCSSEGRHDQICSEDARFTSPGPSRRNLHWTSHDVSINNSQLNDSGVYVCVLNKLKRRRKNNIDGQNTQDQSELDTEDRKRKRHWIVIRSITVNVTRNSQPEPTRKKPGADVGWYVAGAVLLIILIAVILLLARQKMKSNKASQSLMMQRSCHGDQGTTEPDCAPYAVGVRQHEPYSVVHIRKQTDSVGSTPAGPSGQSSDVPEPYSVVHFRPQPDSVGSTPAGQTADVPETYSVITPNNTQ